MHVEFATETEQWGGWQFGDLAVAVCRAVEVVGPAADVVSVGVRQPESGLAQVSLWVNGTEEMLRLRDETQSGEYVASAWRVDGVGWHAVVNGISLQVSATRDRS
jgi:hypothetical protein